MADEQQTPEKDDSQARAIGERFHKTLDSQGYSFQFAAIEKLQECFGHNGLWELHVSEFPVVAGKFDARIDFVLYARTMGFYLACECKRANPRMKHWCFVQAPFVRRNAVAEHLMVDRIELWYAEASATNPRGGVVSCAKLNAIDNVYHLGFEEKDGKEKGDPHGGGGRNAIEDAAFQACKGANGLLTVLRGLQRQVNPRYETDKEHYFVMPTIFTTANLWACDTNLSAADLSTGEIPADARQQIRKVDWLFYQYPLSPAVKHDLDEAPGDTDELGKILDNRFRRTIGVVGPDGIEEYLQLLSSYIQ